MSDNTEKLNADELIATAQAMTGLNDFDAPDIRESLTTLVMSLNEEAALTPEAILAKRGSLLRALCNRLKLANAVHYAPQFENEIITRPVFVIGLQRSGTTKLHRVLAADDAIQKLPLWRLLEPVKQLAAGEEDNRLENARSFVKGMQSASPEAYAAHPMYADQPDEEVFVMELAFLANINATAFRAPSYNDWLNKQDFESWYVWFRRLLKYIQYTDGKSGQQWILKAPHHLGFLPLLFKYFPDAIVVNCHRDPLVAVPSFAALAAAARRSTSNSVDNAEVGRYCLDYCKSRLDTYLKDRDQLGRENQFLDISYREVKDDVIKVVQRVYQSADIPFTSQTRAAIQRWETEFAQHKHGKHSYSASEYAMDEDEMLAAFAEYRDRFAEYI